MNRRGSIAVRLLITTGLVLAAVIACIRYGAGWPAVLCAAVAVAAFWRWFLRVPRPENELPSAAVSCCHYLGDPEAPETRRPGPRLQEEALEYGRVATFARPSEPGGLFGKEITDAQSVSNGDP